MSSLGSTEATPTLYFHGLPGGPEELEALAPGGSLRAVDRLSCKGGSYPERVAGLADRLAPTGPHRIVAFSLGAMTALRLAADHPGCARELILVAPAAPLTLGPFLDDMVGAPLFRLAMKDGLGFRAITRVQGALLRLMPRPFLKQLFASSPAGDRALLDEAEFAARLITAYRGAVIGARAAYSDEIIASVQDWSDVLPRVSCPVELHLGTEDNWVPPGLVRALAKALGQHSPIEHDGAGHYGTARRVLASLSSASPG